MIHPSHHVESIHFRFTPLEKQIEGYISDGSNGPVAFHFKRSRFFMRNVELVYGKSKIQYQRGQGKAEVGGYSFNFNIRRSFPVLGEWVLGFTFRDSNFRVAGRYLNKDKESGNWLIQRNLTIDGIEHPYAFSVNVGQDLPLVGKVKIRDSSNELDNNWSDILFPVILCSSLMSDIIPLRVN